MAPGPPHWLDIPLAQCLHNKKKVWGLFLFSLLFRTALLVFFFGTRSEFESQRSRDEAWCSGNAERVQEGHWWKMLRRIDLIRYAGLSAVAMLSLATAVE